MQKLSRHIGRITMLPVNLKIHFSHFLIRNLSSQFCNGRPHLRMPSLSLAANYGHRLIGGEVVLIVCEDHKVARRKQSIGGISSNKIHLFVQERAIQQSQIENSRWFREVQPINAREALVSIGPLHELISKACAP